MKKVVLDDIDHQILDILIENARVPFTDIAKELLVSAGTIHVRVNKMKEEDIIQGATLSLNYKKLGYPLIAHVGMYLEKTSMSHKVIEDLKEIANVTVAHVVAGKFNIFCKVRAKSISDAKDIVYKIDKINGVKRTETVIALEESINDKKRIMRKIFKDIK